MSDEELLTAAEAASLLKVTERTIRRYHKEYLKKGIHWYRIGQKGVRYSKRMLLALVFCNFDTLDPRYISLVGTYQKEKDSLLRPKKSGRKGRAP